MPEAPPVEDAFYPEGPQPGQEYGPQQPVPSAAPRQQGALASDFQYFFWSMSILTGAALTLFSFIYACIT